MAGRLRVRHRIRRGGGMSLEWLLIRGSGLAAYAMLALATIWGLLISTGLLGRKPGVPVLTRFHESLGIGALLATIVHMVALRMHDYVPFSWREILLPGASDWRPVAVGLGVVSFYVLTVVTVSFYVKRFIGLAAWRAIHMLTFGMFVAATVHGILAGTDTGEAPIAATYGAVAAVAVILLIVRVSGRSGASQPVRRAARPDAPVPAARESAPAA